MPGVRARTSGQGRAARGGCGEAAARRHQPPAGRPVPGGSAVRGPSGPQSGRAAGVTRRPGGPHTGDDVAAHAGEVRVNVGGEPDRDDFGLPPVDIEIPDDARELDRDVQAYRRELRALRRRMRIGRLHGPLTRDGLMLPLLAGCLAIVLISGVLLTVFTAGRSGAPRPSAGSPAQVTHASIRPVPTAARAAGLPNAKVIIAGRPVELSSLSPTVLALVPAGCQCTAALRQLRQQTAAARVSLYLVGVNGDMPRVRQLAARAGQPRGRVANDTSNALATAYQAQGLTAILVGADGSVTLSQVMRDLTARDVGPGSRLAGLFPSLTPPSP
jgi:hypothetical protein